MPEPIYLDTETCGLHGPIVLFQYAEGDGPVTLYSPWTEPIDKTLALYERVANHPGGIVGYNLVFDVFHICKQYTTLLELRKVVGGDAFPEDHIDQAAICEEKARDGPCWKPVTACDLMLWARKSTYQKTMERHDIRIRRVPGKLAKPLVQELEERVVLSEVLFARRKNKNAPKWKIADIRDKDGNHISGFVDVVLSFAPSAALKVLAVEALGVDPDEVMLFDEVSVPDKLMPNEVGYAPFAMAIGKPGAWNNAWPAVIRHHIDHWLYDAMARKYAAFDVTLTRLLHKSDVMQGAVMGDDDSVLACCVAACRWKGYAIDVERVKELRDEAVKAQGQVPQAPGPVTKWIKEVLSPVERLVWSGSTKKTYLEEIAKWGEQPCPECQGLGLIDPDFYEGILEGEDCSIELKVRCPSCNGEKSKPHPAAIRASAVLAARGAKKRQELYEKLLQAGRFHASFRIIGTLSSRMAGGDGLNPQAIPKEPEVRAAFPLAFSNYELWMGDYDAFEICVFVAASGDKELEREVLSGKKVHALFGQCVFKGMSYDEIKESKPHYGRAKAAVFALLYGGTDYALTTRLGVPTEDAKRAMKEFEARYPGVGLARRKVTDNFSPLRQVDGIGSKIEWHESSEYVESLNGFRRYFTTELEIAQALFELAQDPPKEWTAVLDSVERRQGRIQTTGGATQSALYGAAFSIQSSMQRCAQNHTIQSTGSLITKELQRRLWDLQPSGVHEFRVLPMNVHDEVLAPCLPEYAEQVRETVARTNEEHRKIVPLISMRWQQGRTWADK